MRTNLASYLLLILLSRINGDAPRNLDLFDGVWKARGLVVIWYLKQLAFHANVRMLGFLRSRPYLRKIRSYFELLFNSPIPREKEKI